MGSHRVDTSLLPCEECCPGSSSQLGHRKLREEEVRGSVAKAFTEEVCHPVLANCCKKGPDPQRGAQQGLTLLLRDGHLLLTGTRPHPETRTQALSSRNLLILGGIQTARLFRNGKISGYVLNHTVFKYVSEAVIDRIENSDRTDSRNGMDLGKLLAPLSLGFPIQSGGDSPVLPRRL